MADRFAPMGATRITDQVDGTYLLGSAFAWVRETLVNAQQAGARHVLYGVEPVARARFGVLRRTVLDDGCGMTADQMVAYVNSFGGSGSAQAGGANFGYGAKVSLLPWNPDGVTVLSRRDGHTTLMKLGRVNGRYGAIMLPGDYDQDDGTTLTLVNPYVEDLQDYGTYGLAEDWTPDGEDLDWVQVMNAALGDRPSGTVFVLHGDDTHHDTATTGDPSRHEDAAYGIAQYLNNHFLDTPSTPDGDPMDVQVQSVTFGRGRATPAVHTGAMQPLRYSLDNPPHAAKTRGRRRVDTGVVTLRARDGVPFPVDVHWWLVPSDAFRRDVIDPSGFYNTTSGLRASYPITGVAASFHPGVTEVFELQGRGIAGAVFNRAVVGSRMEKIIRYAGCRDLRERLSMMFVPRPVKGAVLVPSSMGRGGVAYRTAAGVEPVPWADWLAATSARLPAPVRAEIDLLLDANRSDRDAQLDRTFIRQLGQAYLPAFTVRVPETVLSAGGSLHGTPQTHLARRSKKPTGPHLVETGRAPGDPTEPDTVAVDTPDGPTHASPSRTATASRKHGGRAMVAVQFVGSPTGADLAPHIITMDRRGGQPVALINRNSTAYLTCRDYIVDGWLTGQGRVRAGADETDPTYQLAVRWMERAMLAIAATSVTYALQRQREAKARNLALDNRDAVSHRYDDQELQAMVSDAAMSVCLGGIRAVQSEMDHGGNLAKHLPVTGRGAPAQGDSGLTAPAAA